MFDERMNCMYSVVDGVVMFFGGEREPECEAG